MKHIDKKSIKSSLRRGLLTGLVAGLPFAMLADIMVTGRVIDAGTGAILPGARITVVDGTATAMTNGEGEYTLNAPKGNVTLKIEAPGFNPAYVALRGQTALDIRLRADNGQNPIGVTTADNSVSDLQGDLFSVSRSGMPGAGHAVFVDGLHSISSSSQPLYVVDGVIWATADGLESSIVDGHFSNPLALIDPNDIESVKVLRNGTALYGAKGGNGVVYITTKRAKDEATKIEAWPLLGAQFDSRDCQPTRI